MFWHPHRVLGILRPKGEVVVAGSSWKMLEERCQKYDKQLEGSTLDTGRLVKRGRVDQVGPGT